MSLTVSEQQDYDDLAFIRKNLFLSKRSSSLETSYSGKKTIDGWVAITFRRLREKKYADGMLTIGVTFGPSDVSKGIVWPRC